MQELRQSTEVKVRIGSAVDATDGVTPETGLTLGAADQAELLKHNGAATVDISASTFAAITAVDGWYDLTLTAGNTDTLGQITVAIQDSSLMVPIFRDFMVVTANYWDSKYSTDVRHADVTQCGGSAVAAGAIPNAAADAAGGLPVSDAGALDLDTKLANTNEITAARMGALTDWINGGRLDLILDIIAADTTTDIPALIATAQADLDILTGADGVTLATAQALYAPNKVVPDVAGTLATYDPPTNTEMVAAFTEIKGATWAAGTDTLEHIRNKQTDIETDTGEIGAAGAGLTDLGGMSTGMKAEVQTEANDALIAQNLDHLMKIAVDTNWATTVHLDSALGHIADVGTAATFNRITDALEAIRDRGDAAWSAAAGNPNVLIDTTIATLATQTSFTLTAGSDIDDAYKDQAIVLYDASNNDYPSVRKVSAYTGATKTVTLDSAPDFTAIAGDGVKTFVTAPGTTAPTAGQVADAVLDELVTDHTIANSLSKAVSDTLTDVSAIDVLSEAGGSGDLAAIKTQVDAILDLERESGVVTVTDVETTLYEDAAPTKNKLGVVVKVDMAALEAADTFVVKEKYKDESGGAYQVVDEVSYTGAQTNPLRIIALTPYRYGAIITMQRTAGTNRSIEWESFVEE